MPDRRLREETEAALRRLGPRACQDCALYRVERSALSGVHLERCGCVDESQPNGGPLSRVMLRLAADGHCPEWQALAAAA